MRGPRSRKEAQSVIELIESSPQSPVPAGDLGPMLRNPEYRDSYETRAGTLKDTKIDERDSYIKGCMP